MQSHQQKKSSRLRKLHVSDATELKPKRSARAAGTKGS
jgi:hypothetical protein